MKYSYLPESAPQLFVEYRIAANFSNIRMLSNANTNFFTSLVEPVRCCQYGEGGIGERDADASEQADVTHKCTVGSFCSYILFANKWCHEEIDKKVKGQTQLFIGDLLQSYGVSPAIWDHRVTCHLTQVNAPAALDSSFKVMW